MIQCFHLPRFLLTILSLGAAVDDVTLDGGETALHFAAKEGHLEVVHVLGAFGADVDAFSSRSGTPAKCAMSWGHIGVFSALEEMGASVADVDV